MTEDIQPKTETEDKKYLRVATANFMGGHSLFGEGAGTFYMPQYQSDHLSGVGLSPEKLVVPKDYHRVIRMCYDFYQRGGIVSTVINRLAEFTITDIRNGQRKTSDEANLYFQCVLHSKPSRLMRFLRTATLEYFLTGMVLPRVEWVPMLGKDIHPGLKPNKEYIMPAFDLYPPLLVKIEWEDWGKKTFWLQIPESTIELIKNKGGDIKEQQLKYQQFLQAYPSFVQLVNKGANTYQIKDSDPILRKEISITPYPTPYLFPVLEPLIYKQQLRRMDFAVASRVINAILLVREGNDEFPLVDEADDRLEQIKAQILARQDNPLLIERLFILFTNHTTQLEWITPDVEAMLNQGKYEQVNSDLEEGLGFTKILLTGESRGSEASEVSTWAVRPMMEEVRDMWDEWVEDIYHQASEKNSFRNTPVASFKPIKLQDFVKTAAVFQALFSEGNVSRTTRAEMADIDFETEAELMKDEAEIAKGLPAFNPTPYSPLPPAIGGGAGPGRPIGSQNVPVNKRNSGVKPPGQKPTSQVRTKAELLDDDEVIAMIDEYAKSKGIVITVDDIIDKNSPE